MWCRQLHSMQLWLLTSSYLSRTGSKKDRKLGLAIKPQSASPVIHFLQQASTSRPICNWGLSSNIWVYWWHSHLDHNFFFRYFVVTIKKIATPDYSVDSTVDSTYLSCHTRRETETENPFNLGPVKIWSDSRVRKTSGSGPSLPFLRRFIVPILWDSKFSLQHALVWTFFSHLVMATVSEATVFGGKLWGGLLPPWMDLCVIKTLRGFVSSLPSSKGVLHPLVFLLSTMGGHQQDPPRVCHPDLRLTPRAIRNHLCAHQHLLSAHIAPFGVLWRKSWISKLLLNTEHTLLFVFLCLFALFHGLCCSSSLPSQNFYLSSPSMESHSLWEASIPSGPVSGVIASSSLHSFSWYQTCWSMGLE